MMFDTCKPIIKLQTALGGVQCILFAASLGSILSTLQKYHDSDRLNFNCDPNPVILSDNVAITTTFPQLPSLMG